MDSSKTSVVYTSPINATPAAFRLAAQELEEQHALDSRQNGLELIGHLPRNFVERGIANHPHI